MKHITLNNFFRLLKECVIYFPVDKTTGLSCKQLQTFAVLEEYSDLDSETLSKVPLERKKSFFFSRSWAHNKFNPSKIDVDYPGLFLFEQNFITKDLFSKRKSRTYIFEVAVLDLFREECSDKASDLCKSRNRNEIFIDTELLLDKVFDYFDEVIAADVVVSGDNISGFFHKKVLDLLLSNNKIDSYQIDKPSTNSFISNLRRSNENSNSLRWDKGNKKYYGTTAIINLTTDSVCINEDFNFDFVNYPVTYDKGCC